MFSLGKGIVSLVPGSSSCFIPRVERGPCDQEILHHVAVLELVPDGVRVVWVGLFKESLEVVGKRLHLTFVALCGSHDMPHAGATCHPVVAVVIVGCGRSPLRMLHVPPWCFGRRRWMVPPYRCLGLPPCFLEEDKI
jgi:hypothetical protein